MSENRVILQVQLLFEFVYVIFQKLCMESRAKWARELLKRVLAFGWKIGVEKKMRRFLSFALNPMFYSFLFISRDKFGLFFCLNILDFGTDIDINLTAGRSYWICILVDTIDFMPFNNSIHGPVIKYTQLNLLLV